MRSDFPVPATSRTSNLIDVLDRVLDKGLVVAGDIKVSLAEVELLTIRIRLIVCSLDKAEEIGLDWWRYDKNLAPGRNVESDAERKRLEARVRQLESQLARLSGRTARTPNAKRRTSGARNAR